MPILAEVIEKLEQKLNNAGGGSAGQQLFADGYGGIYWDAPGHGDITAEKLVIGDREYTVRTGTEGASGFITIAANDIYIGTKKYGMYLGKKRVMAIYLGTSKVYEPLSAYRLYYNAYVNGISWKVNGLPRKQYTRLAFATLENANVGSGYMRIYLGVRSGEEEYYHNAHVMTVDPVLVPAGATKLHVYCRNTQNGIAMNLRFGLLPSNAPNSYSTTNGGVMSKEETIIGTAWQDITLDIPENIKGTNNLHCVINGEGVPPSSSETTTPALRVAWVYFD